MLLENKVGLKIGFRILKEIDLDKPINKNLSEKMKIEQKHE